MPHFNRQLITSVRGARVYWGTAGYEVTSVTAAQLPEGLSGTCHQEGLNVGQTEPINHSEGTTKQVKY